MANVKYLGLSELAYKWGVNTRTLRKYINKIQHQIPFYDEHQRMFAPIQYNKIAALLGFEI